MKTTIKILLYLFACIGLSSILYVAWTIQQDRNKEQAFEKNCRKIYVDMTIKQAIDTMSIGLNYDYDLYQLSFDKQYENPTDFYITYPIDGGSYLVTIHFDKHTGKVTSVDRPNDDWFDNR